MPMEMARPEPLATARPEPVATVRPERLAMALPELVPPEPMANHAMARDDGAEQIAATPKSTVQSEQMAPTHPEEVA